ncbi:MAG: Crp/Fnr family transcriptional regulator [Cyclobacteriaceae bacterium]|nr:Crp/Fnr family transcriptional regulator [Cyclobacteriaceae bacterium]
MPENTEALVEKIKEYYEFLLEDGLIVEIANSGVFKQLKEGHRMMEIGDSVKYMPLLLTGAIKILREDEEGDELLLYFLEKGDTCAMTMTCCYGESKSRIRAIIEKDAEIVLIPIHKMEEWLAKYKSWRSFVFESYNIRLNEMLETIDTLAFLKMDERLYKYLTGKAVVTQSTTISNTHQEIAYDLHTSRVVVSRLLKQLEHSGKIKLYRNKIEVLKF